MRPVFLFLLTWSIQVHAEDAPLVFSKEKIQVGKTTLEVEIANDEPKRNHGLMFRHELADGKGMLFIFDDERPRAFWMKNTFIPLSIGFFNQKSALVDIQDMDAVKSEMQTDIPQYQSRKSARFALEVPRGWFQRAKIKLGDRLARPNQSR